MLEDQVLSRLLINTPLGLFVSARIVQAVPLWAIIGLKLPGLPVHATGNS